MMATKMLPEMEAQAAQQADKHQQAMGAMSTTDQMAALQAMLSDSFKPPPAQQTSSSHQVRLESKIMHEQAMAMFELLHTGMQAILIDIESIEALLALQLLKTTSRPTWQVCCIPTTVCCILGFEQLHSDAATVHGKSSSGARDRNAHQMLHSLQCYAGIFLAAQSAGG